MLPGWYLPPTLQGQLGFFISSRKAGRVKHKALANTYWANYPYSLILIHRVVWKTLLLDGNPYMQREYRVGCSRRVSYFLCRGCFELRGPAVCGVALLRAVWGTGGLRGLRVRRVPGQGLCLRRH